MSASAYLVCRSREMLIALGKPIRRPDGTVDRFDPGSVHGAQRAQLDRALWKFLADTAGNELTVAFDTDRGFDAIAEFREIGGLAEEGDVPFDQYLEEPPRQLSGTRSTAEYTYFGSVPPGRTRATPAGVFRRSFVEGYPVDEAFSRRLRWEPTTFLREYEFGHNDMECVEITAAEVDAFVQRMATKYGG